MKLAVFSGQYFWFDGKNYSTDEAFVKFVTSFYPNFEKIIFCDPLKQERKTQPYLLDPTKSEICPLPDFSIYSCLGMLVNIPRICCILRDNSYRWDLAWLHVPHPVSLILAHFCHKNGKPFFLVVRQNLVEQIRHRKKGLRRLFAVTAVVILEQIYRRLAGKNLTFTVGDEMYLAYARAGAPVYKIAVSLVSRAEIEETNRIGGFELHTPIRVLSVGRLDPEKGLTFLIRAIAQLAEKVGLNVTLRIIGETLMGGEKRALLKEIARHRLEDRVELLGYVTHGPELFRLYRESDVFVLPSLTGEGVPQTLFEAMASGVPIVATRVAGIPGLIEDGVNGLLVNPGSPKEIAVALEELSANSDLRMRLISKGLETAEDHTLEVERDRMMKVIDTVLVKKTGAGHKRRQAVELGI